MDMDSDDEINDKNENITIKPNLNVMCINTQGLYSNKAKRIELNFYLNINEIDICLVQEWYLHSPEYDINFINNDFENYNIIYNNNKTLILVNNELNIIDLEMKNINYEGMDITWIAIEANENDVFTFGSFYHSPREECDAPLDILTVHINEIKQKL